MSLKKKKTGWFVWVVRKLGLLSLDGYNNDKLNYVYLKPRALSIVPKISTEKFRRRFGVDNDKLLSNRIKTDSEHLEIPQMNPERRPSFHLLHEEFKKADKTMMNIQSSDV